MLLHNKSQKNYTLNQSGYQLKLLFLYFYSKTAYYNLCQTSIKHSVSFLSLSETF